MSSGGFIPELVNSSRDAGSGEPQVVDLFELATHTAAVAQYNDEYRNVRDEVLRRAGLDGSE